MKKIECIQIQWTCGSVQEARTTCRYLVQERMVACANIIPWVESIYMWDNKLNTEQETKVILKTTRDRFEQVKEVILEQTEYEVPEILVISIEDGNQSYIDWVKESTSLAIKG